MWHTIGHDKAVSILERSVAEDHLAHGYLLLGPANVGKTTLAFELAQAVNCTSNDKPCGQCTQCQRIASGKHADVKIVCRDVFSKEGKERIRTEISIDQVRDLQRAASLSPYEGKCSVFIVDGAQYLSQEAANSLLKTLEEPPSQVLIILLSDEMEESLMSTVVSRCQVIELSPVSPAVIEKSLVTRWGADVSKAEELARLSGGRIGWAVTALNDPGFLTPRLEHLNRIAALFGSNLEERLSYSLELAQGFTKNREYVKEELELWLSMMRDILMVKEGIAGLISNLAMVESLETIASRFSTSDIVTGARYIETTWKDLEQNANPRLTLESLMLKLPIIDIKPTLETNTGESS